MTITAREAGYDVCHTCLALSPTGTGHCIRCGSHLHDRIPDSMQRTVALLIASVVLYLPANLLPIMTTDQFGRSVDSTIIGGVVLLWNMGSYPVALVILIASVLVPIGKILIVATLCWTVGRHQTISSRQRTTLYRITEFIGKWSMVDVFVVAILVALIQITGIIVIRPGGAALAFAGVVILTMLAAESFDPRLIWDDEAADGGTPGTEEQATAQTDQRETA
jgi:paraquat-inducible protein A